MPSARRPPGNTPAQTSARQHTRTKIRRRDSLTIVKGTPAAQTEVHPSGLYDLNDAIMFLLYEVLLAVDDVETGGKVLQVVHANTRDAVDAVVSLVVDDNVGDTGDYALSGDEGITRLGGSRKIPEVTRVRSHHVAVGAFREEEARVLGIEQTGTSGNSRSLEYRYQTIYRLSGGVSRNKFL